jgi:hypothetical protein
MMDEYMTLAQAASTVTIAGQKRTAKTYWEWCAHGIRGVRCHYIRYGNTYLVREQDLIEFAQRLGEVQTVGKKHKRSNLTPAQRLRAAQERLVREGI